MSVKKAAVAILKAAAVGAILGGTTAVVKLIGK